MCVCACMYVSACAYMCICIYVCMLSKNLLYFIGYVVYMCHLWWVLHMLTKLTRFHMIYKDMKLQMVAHIYLIDI